MRRTASREAPPKLACSRGAERQSDQPLSEPDRAQLLQSGTLQYLLLNYVLGLSAEEFLVLPSAMVAHRVAVTPGVSLSDTRGLFVLTQVLRAPSSTAPYTAPSLVAKPAVSGGYAAEGTQSCWCWDPAKSEQFVSSRAIRPVVLLEGARALGICDPALRALVLQMELPRQDWLCPPEGEETRERHRAQFCALRDEHPDMRVVALRTYALATYTSLESRPRVAQG